FITAGAYLRSAGLEFGGHMVAAMALMESPAIVVGVLLVRAYAPAQGESRAAIGHLVREAFVNGSVLLILGSLVIGYASGDDGWTDVAPFTDGIFKGMLSFFLLDMGLVAARRLRDLRQAGWFLPAFGVAAPLLNAAVAIGLAGLLGFAPGDALMFAVLCASASYIAVPAAVRLAIPEANPTLYVSMALAVTFPFNIVVGLPLYLGVIRATW
ncbi:MAG: sodium-dependent bicarbonate transport family permease, partial [Vicinamibacterales bacterium]|nr:sodium-dependent bicarbonate transport family permease [Vicinamibacterales bacterium]